MNLFYVFKNLYKKIFKNKKLNNKLKIKLIEKKRKKIDKINKIIINNILERTILAKEVIELKLNIGHNIEDKNRENEIKKDIEDYLKSKLKKFKQKKINRKKVKLDENLLLKKIDEIFEMLFFISKN